MLGRLGALLAARDIPYEKGEPMARRTTLRVGGPADYLVEARGALELAAALQAAKEAGEPALVIGNGSNLLVRDSGIRGLVIVIGQGMQAVTREGETLYAQAGATLARVAQIAQAEGLSGMEALSGIPGTVGGAVCMNAGAYGTETADVVVSAEVLDGEGRVSNCAAEVIAFGYRSSAVAAKGLAVTGVSIRLVPGVPEEIGAAMRAYAAKRREKQPLSLPSAGSFFKRPEGCFAGALIERAGLKGVSVGGARVSEKHAGFLVNTGGASAQDFLDLMELIQARVFSASGVRLEPEVRILG
ncbi:MAG: UDP-N-acetylmuramate dehydrogenase [Firmicutes bacterium]|nr:UDP-N-acetylmuramate dehydrogenase [Bacillota bacterium]